MELTPEQLQEKIKTLKIELQAFMQSEQAEINEMSSIVQQRVRAAQKHADNLEGKINAYQEMLGGNDQPQPDSQDTVTTMSSTKPAPPIDVVPPPS